MYGVTTAATGGTDVPTTPTGITLFNQDIANEDAAKIGIMYHFPYSTPRLASSAKICMPPSQVHTVIVAEFLAHGLPMCRSV